MTCCNYTFSVYTDSLLEAKASNLVRHYLGKAAGSKEGDAQSLYQDLLFLFEQGIAAQTNHVNLEQQLLTLCLDRSWTKSIVSFLTHFLHLLEELKELHEPNDFTSYDDQ